jgi:hypothetical protein
MAFHGQLGLTRVFAKEPGTPQDWRNLGALEIPPKKPWGFSRTSLFFCAVVMIPQEKMQGI